MLKNIIFSSIFMIFFMSNMLAQQETTIAPTKLEKIKTLLTLIRTEDLYKQNIQLFINNITNETQGGERFLEIFTYEKMMEKIIIPIYDKYYTETDLEEIIAFYNRPIGKKLIQIMPSINQEVISNAAKWARETLKNYYLELEKEKTTVNTKL